MYLCVCIIYICVCECMYVCIYGGGVCTSVFYTDLRTYIPLPYLKTSILSNTR